MRCKKSRLAPLLHSFVAVGCLQQGNEGIPVEPGNMLWLIQRDFLQGKSVQKLVDEALAPVLNPNNDKDIAGLNRIRESLATIAANSTGAFSVS